MNALNIAIVAALLATAGALFLGVGSMAHGGVFDHRYSTRFMSARVLLQAVALVMLGVALLLN